MIKFDVLVRYTVINGRIVFVNLPATADTPRKLLRGPQSSVPFKGGRRNVAELTHREMCDAVQWAADNLPDGVSWGGPWGDERPQGTYTCAHCDSAWPPQGGPEENLAQHRPDCGLVRFYAAAAALPELVERCEELEKELAALRDRLGKESQ